MTDKTKWTESHSESSNMLYNNFVCELRQTLQTVIWRVDDVKISTTKLNGVLPK